MSIYAGIFNTTLSPPELNARSFAGTILRRQPNGGAPLFGMTAMAGRTQAKASTHGYFSKTMEFSRATATALVAAGTAVFPVTSSVGLVPGQVLHYAPTGENIRILSIAGNTLTTTRGFGRVAAAAIPANGVLVVVGSAYEEGSARPVARGIIPVYVSNFTQIFRNAWALTDTARASYAEAGYSNIAESQRDCMTFHSTDIESALFFGQAKMDVAGNKPLHATQGIIDAVRQYAPSNAEALDPAGDGVDYDDMVDLLTGCFKYSSDGGDAKTRVAFVDAAAMSTFQKMGRLFPDSVTVTTKETAFGMVFSEFRFFKGRIMLLEHSLFNGLQTSEGLAVVVDVPSVKLAYMDGRDAKAETYGVGGTNGDGPGIDAQGGSLTSEFATEFMNPQGCAVITGLVKAKKRIVYTQEVPAVP